MATPKEPQPQPQSAEAREWYLFKPEGWDRYWANDLGTIIPVGTIHVIEKSAYDKLREENARLKNGWLDEHSLIAQENAQLTVKLSAAEAELEQYRTYIPKVPTEPYEKQMAKRIVELEAELAALTPKTDMTPWPEKIQLTWTKNQCTEEIEKLQSQCERLRSFVNYMAHFTIEAHDKTAMIVGIGMAIEQAKALLEQTEGLGE